MADHGKIFLLVPSLVFLLLAFETEVYHDKNGGQGAYSEQELAAATASEQRVAAGRSGGEERRRGGRTEEEKKNTRCKPRVNQISKIHSRARFGPPTKAARTIIVSHTN